MVNRNHQSINHRLTRDELIAELQQVRDELFDSEQAAEMDLQVAEKTVQRRRERLNDIRDERVAADTLLGNMAPKAAGDVEASSPEEWLRGPTIWDD